MDSPRQYTGWEARWHLLKLRISSWLYWNTPQIVWPGQEVDVLVTFSENKLLPVSFNPDDQAGMSKVIAQLTQGHLPEIERAFAEMGITFDKGMGPSGRDWEWDFSLSGPIQVKFKRRAQRPDRRAQPLGARDITRTKGEK